MNEDNGYGGARTDPAVSRELSDRRVENPFLPPVGENS